MNLIFDNYYSMKQFWIIWCKVLDTEYDDTTSTKWAVAIKSFMILLYMIVNVLIIFNIMHHWKA